MIQRPTLGDQSLVLTLLMSIASQTARTVATFGFDSFSCAWFELGPSAVASLSKKHDFGPWALEKLLALPVYSISDTISAGHSEAVLEC